MGGGKSGKSQTIGYKYYIGMHLVACHGPVDALTRLTVDERVAWEGSTSGGTITVSADNLFGGESREGGVSGNIDVLMGLPAQGKNGYLLAKIGPNIPAYRGVVSLVFNQTYMGNNPYLKAWRMRMTRIHIRQDGNAQWYDAKASIPSGGLGFATDVTVSWWQASFHPVTGNDQGRIKLTFFAADGVTELGNAAAPMQGVLPVLTWTQRTLSATAPQGTGFIRVQQDRQRFEGVANDAYIDDIELTVGGRNVPLTNPGAESGVTGWTQVTGPDCLRATSGDLPAHSGTKYFDGGGYSVSTAYQDVPAGAVFDLNPAHIIRECLTNQDWGMGYADADVDDVTFMAAADTLWAEGMGISLLWSEQTTLESFISDIIRHIDGALYVSRQTGKFTLKLTRPGYDPATLLLLDESNIDKIDNPSRPAFGELVNSVSVAFWNAGTGKDDLVTVQDPAAVQMQGSAINTTVQYPGFTNQPLAARVADRDLRALSSPFLTCTVFTSEKQAESLDIGDCFKLTWGKWQVFETVMRVTGFAISDGRSAQVRINCVEDVFTTPLNSVIAPPATSWVDPSGPPTAAAAHIAFEAPYLEVIKMLGQADADADLAADHDLGFIGAAAVRGGTTSVAAELWLDDGSGYADKGPMDLSPGGFLTAALNKTATSFTVTSFRDLDLIEIGSHAQIGTGANVEIVRVDGVDGVTGVFTVGRGCLDTVPQKHLIGESVLAWATYHGFDTTEYASGESIDVKVTPTSGSGAVPLAGVTADTVVMSGRAFRPYPPGNLKINGVAYQDGANLNGDLAISWAHRDRTQQTGGEIFDTEDGDIGPEAGTTYRVRVYINDVLDVEHTGIVGNSDVITPTAEGNARLTVESIRDGIASWQAPFHEFLYSYTTLRVTSDGDIRYTEESDARGTED